MLHDLALSAPDLLREVLDSPPPTQSAPPPAWRTENPAEMGNGGTPGGSQEQGKQIHTMIRYSMSYRYIGYQGFCCKSP